MNTPDVFLSSLGSTYMEILSQTFKNYLEDIDTFKKQPDERRFNSLINLYLNYFRIMAPVIRILLNNRFLNNGDDEYKQTLDNLKDTIEKYFEVMICELEALKEFINNNCETRTEEKLKDIERKLDDVLCGPDYPQGRFIMENAMNDFNKNRKRARNE